MSPTRRVVHLTLIEAPDGRVDVYCSHIARLGHPLSPAQSLAMDLCNHARRAGHVMAFPPHHPLAELAQDLINPEALGLAVTPEVRQRAADALRWLSGQDRQVSAT